MRSCFQSGSPEWRCGSFSSLELCAAYLTTLTQHWILHCVQAMGLMLPHPSKGDTEGTLGGRNPTLEGKMACMSVAGYAACAKSNVALDAVLDEIKVEFWAKSC